MFTIHIGENVKLFYKLDADIKSMSSITDLEVLQCELLSKVLTFFWIRKY